MSSDEPLPFGVLLSRYRTTVGLTQEELAERAGLSPQAISSLERGVRSQPRAYTVRQFIEALGLVGHDREVFEQAALAASASPDTTSAAPPTGAFLGAAPSGALVARSEEQERMRSILSAATEGVGHVMLLSGETGAGKTRLLQDLASEAGARGFIVLTGRCYATEQTTPYYPFVDALSDLTIRLPPHARVEGQRAWNKVQDLLGVDEKRDGTGTGSAVEQQQIFDAVQRLLLLVARAVPLALLFDDLHWADDCSLKLLQHLAHSTRSARVLLAGSFRDLQIGEEHPELAQLLQILSRERLAERITLRRLSLEETTALVATTMGQQDISEEFASFVYRRTKGVPRLVDQLVRSLGGRLELRGEIGAGAMGRVFRAYDRTSEREVAAKLVLARREIDLDTLLHFQKEGAVLARLQHPNIVEIYDTFAEEHASCIVMELLDGQSLGAILQDGPLPLPRAKALALQVAKALAYAHSQEIVHRDIKPDNVMVLEGDQVKVTDFGIARILQPDTSLQTIATTGMRMGTPVYMAPEQIEGKKIDGRTDIYALGAMLFHMVTGRAPFEGSDTLAIAVKHLQEDPVPPSTMDPAIPTSWDAVILKAMAKDPDKRFRSAREMKDAIGALSEMPDVPTRDTSRIRVRVTMAGTLIAVLAAAIGVWAHNATAVHPSSISSRIDGYLSGLVATHALSGTVLVARHGAIVLDKGYGLADRRRGLPNTSDTPYPVGGVSASFSELAALQVIQAGTLHWQTPICTFLPNCPTSWKPITIRMVLNGTANLPNYDWGRAGNTPQQSIAKCEAEPLDGPPGSAIDYQNCSTLVLGAVIENSTGGSWDVDVADIYDLAGMTNSGQVTDAWAQSARAHEYIGNTLFTDSTYNDYFAAYSTTRDIYAYDNALLGGKLLSRRYTDLLFTPRAPVGAPELGINKPYWGYLWKTGVALGHRVVYTSNGTKKFQTVNMRFIDDGVTVVVISNDYLNDVSDIARHVAALVFGKPLPAFVPPSGPAPPGLAGTYHRTFQTADWKAAHDPSLSTFVGGTITITIRANTIHFALLNNLPDSSSDEYYTASSNGNLTLLQFDPLNENNFCSVSLHQASPNGSYHWAKKNGFLIITRSSDKHCADRAAFFTGRWTKVG